MVATPGNVRLFTAAKYARRNANYIPTRTRPHVRVALYVH